MLSSLQNAATGDEDNFRSIHEALPQLKDRITELGKLQEMVVDGEMCDAFYGFNKEHLHTWLIGQCRDRCSDTAFADDFILGSSD